MKALALAAPCVLIACAKEDQAPPPEAPRPVTVVELREIDPVRPMLLTGSVHPWKEADVSFEVAGRVSFIVEAGTFLEGRWVEGDQVQIEGDQLARLDPREYEIGVDQSTASVNVAREQVATAQVQLEKVLPTNRAAAMANRDRAQAEYERYKQAGERRAVSELDVITARAEYDSMQAIYEQSLAAIDTKETEIKALEASHEQAIEGLEQSEYDLERCVLRAPFTGEVSEVFVEAGGYAHQGQAVARLVMLSPIKVDLAVSQQTMTTLRRGDNVSVYVPGQDTPELGTVYEKGTVADPETRTFRISVITENRRSATQSPEDDAHAGMPRIEQAMPLRSSKIAPWEGIFYTEERRALREDDEGYFVWADPRFAQSDDLPDGTVLNLERFRVVPGDRRANFQGIFLVRELQDIGELAPGTMIPLDVPETDQDEIQVLISRPQWLLRPGQLVDVLMGSEVPAPGLYVPIDAIKPAPGDRGVVFVVDDGVVRRVEASILAQVGPLVRVEGEGLEPGALVVTDYVHFLQDGEPVRVIRQREIAR